MDSVNWIGDVVLGEYFQVAIITTNEYSQVRICLRLRHD